MTINPDYKQGYELGVDDERARVVALIEVEQKENRTLYGQAVSKGEDEQANYRMARIHALADLLGKVRK